MAKLCALIVLAAFAVVAHGIRIDPPKPTKIGKYFADDAVARITVDDPICREGNGLYPHPSDCTRYLACRDGVSQVRTCPEGFKFDSRRLCTPDVDADCGKPRATKVKIPSSSAAALTCPEQYGQFPYPGDCRKYITCDDWNPTSWMCNGEQVYEQGVGCWDGGVCHDSEHQQAKKPVTCPESYGYFPYLEDCSKFLVCVDGLPIIHSCPEGNIYQDHIGCIEGTVCPKKSESEDSEVTCRKADALYPHERCDWYYKCVAFRPYIKTCTEGTAFDPKKSKCTKAMFNKCTKKNDLQDIMRA